MLFGTDFPYLSIAAANRGLASANLPDDLMRLIERENALTLFPRFLA
jgi:predicted TIM-barrel fold metal-dependent hydrolase